MNFYWGKVKIVLSFPLAAAMTAVVIADTTQSVILCCLSALLHECGHLAVMKHYGIIPTEIRMSLFDIAIIAPQKQYRGIKQSIAIDLAGVAVNLVCGSVLALIYFFCQSRFVLTAVGSHFMLFLFNILPIESLDGGHALTLLLSLKTDMERAEKIVAVVSFVILIPLSAAGFLLLLRSKYNFTLLLSGLYLIVVLFKKYGKCRHLGQKL